QRIAPQRPQSGQSVELQKSKERSRVYDSSLVRELLNDFSRSAGISQPTAQASRKDVGNFLDSGVQEFLDLNQFGAFSAEITMDPDETSVARFQVGNADCVFVTHPKSEIAGRLGEQRTVAVTSRGINPTDLCQLVQICGRIRHILIVGEFLNRSEENGS